MISLQGDLVYSKLNELKSSAPSISLVINPVCRPSPLFPEIQTFENESRFHTVHDIFAAH